MELLSLLAIIVITSGIVYVSALFFGYKLLKENPWYGVAGLFIVVLIVDILIPDPLPLLDEILLGFASFLTSRKAITGKFLKNK
jgi:hypothetical protein